MRMIVVLGLGMLAGIVLTIMAVTVTGGWHTYRAIPVNNEAEIIKVVEQDGCEPFEARGYLFVRCPRFRLR